MFYVEMKVNPTSTYTPIHIYNALSRHVPSNISLTNVEASPHPTMDRVNSDSPVTHNLDLAFGSSNSRTATQIHQAHRYIEKQLQDIPDGDPIIFTDGSALGNPGPCGSAAICYAEGLKSCPITISEPVSKHSTNYHGEIRGIKLATDFLKSTHNSHHTGNAHIFSDCKAAIQALSSTSLHVTLQNEIDSTQQAIGFLQNTATPPVTVNLYWIPGHAHFEPNELADQAAKSAANQASTTNATTPSTILAIKSCLRKEATNKWQRAWNRESGSECYQHIPVVPRTRYKSTHNRALESKYLRLLTGHSRLKNHIHKLFKEESPCCDCSQERQTPIHIVMECPLHSEARNILFDNIDLTYAKHNTPIWEREITFWDLFTPHHSDPSTRREIRYHLFKFLDTLSLAI